MYEKPSLLINSKQSVHKMVRMIIFVFQKNVKDISVVPDCPYVGTKASSFELRASSFTIHNPQSRSNQQSARKISSKEVDTV
jgi:hypothetical protein